MTPIEFPEQNVVFAKDQPEYLPLPALVDKKLGCVTACFELSEEEMESFDGKIWITVMTFNEPLQPLYLSTKKENHIIVR